MCADVDRKEVTVKAAADGGEEKKFVIGSGEHGRSGSELGMAEEIADALAAVGYLIGRDPVAARQGIAEAARCGWIDRSRWMGRHEGRKIDFGIVFEGSDYFFELIGGVDQVVVRKENDVGGAGCDGVVAVDSGAPALGAAD